MNALQRAQRQTAGETKKPRANSDLRVWLSGDRINIRFRWADGGQPTVTTLDVSSIERLASREEARDYVVHFVSMAIKNSSEDEKERYARIDQAAKTPYANRALGFTKW